MHMGETTSVRDFSVEGLKFSVVCKDPYGFWQVRLDPQGKSTPQPKEIDGVYFTSLTEAEKAITTIVSKKTKKDPKDFKVEVTNPEDKE